MTKSCLKFIDLFAGAGGLSEGFVRAGFSPIAHIEMDKEAVNTLKTRMAYHYLLKNNRINVYNAYLKGETTRDQLYQNIPQGLLETCMCETISKDSLPEIYKKIDDILNGDTVDVIIGGPPCQAYSLVGRSIKLAQDKIKIENNEKVEDDPRNYLYRLYCEFLKKYKPKMFVFENVTGLLSAQNGKFYNNFKLLAKRCGYIVEDKILEADKFGVKQSRKRVIIVGWLKDTNLKYPEFKEFIDKTTINEMFADLPALEPGEEKNNYKSCQINNYLIKSKIRSSDDILVQHVARPHIDRDRQIYKIAIEEWNDGHKRLHYDELPEGLKTHKNRKSFVDRFKVVEGDTNACHTMMAHISKDGHYFIHPDIKQARSISVREAARIQSFPDNYYFEGGRTAAFRQIGNAVPPLMAVAIAKGIKNLIKSTK